MDVPCENHTKFLNTFCGQNTEFLNLADGGTYHCHWTLADFIYLFFFVGGGGIWGTGVASSVGMNVQSSVTGPCLQVPASPCSISIMQAIEGSAARLCAACPSAEN